MVASQPGRLILGESRWDLSTFEGRFRHFLNITDPRLSVCEDKHFVDAKTLVCRYMQGTEPPGTSQEQLWRAQKLYMSAYHPDSGEKQNRIGRMSFQAPAFTVIAIGNLNFYRNLPAVMVLQWVNQSFNAVVNYTNRNATSPITNRQIGIAYVSATAGAFLAAFSFSHMTKNSLPVIRRFLPFFTVSAAHIVNVPLSRQQEIIHGVKVYNKHGQELGTSHHAAYKGIAQVVVSRIAIVIPTLGGIPIIMETLLRRNWFRKARWAHIPLQTCLVGAIMAVMIPVGCALFPQKASIATSQLEPALSNKIREQYGETVDTVYFNKGL